MTRRTKTADAPDVGANSGTLGGASAEAQREKPNDRTDSGRDGAGSVALNPYEAIAAAYSERARAARVTQGLPAVVSDRSVLAKVSAWMDDDLNRTDQTSQVA